MTDQPRFCTSCGAPLATNIRFCESCGQPVAPTSPESQPTPKQPGQVPPPVYNNYTTPKPVQSQPVSRPIPPLQPPQKRSLSLPLIIGLGALTLCCLGAVVLGGGWLIFRDRAASVLEEPGLPDSISETAIVETVTEIPEAPAPNEPAAPTPEIIEPLTEDTAPPDQTSPPEANVAFDRVSFYLDPSIAAGITGEIVPASNGEEPAYFDIYPEYVQIDLDGYKLVDTFHDARIFVYPVLEYASVNESASRIIGDLRRILAEQTVPDANDDMPFLPIWPAAQYMHVQVKYFDFQNGAGVRYLTQYGQDVYPINNDNLFYTYQGLTDDGLYYIASVLPVSHPELPSADSIEIDQGFYDGFEIYLEDMNVAMNEWEASSYTPDLEMLDELIASLGVSP